MNTTLTTWLIWIVVIYLAIGAVMAGLWAVFAWSQGGAASWADLARALLTWPYWLIAMFGRHS